jgi:hypothetical protein
MVELHTVWRLVTKETKVLREARGLRPKGIPSKDAMIQIHQAYERLRTCVRRGNNLPEALFAPAIELAARCADLACAMPSSVILSPSVPKSVEPAK